MVNFELLKNRKEFDGLDFTSRYPVLRFWQSGSIEDL
jgi:hypothetical protein